MPRQQTEKGLEEAIDAGGGFDGLASTARAPRRDSPFGKAKLVPKMAPRRESPVELKTGTKAPPEAFSPEAAPSQPTQGPGRRSRRYADPSLEAVTMGIRAEARDKNELIARKLQRMKRGRLDEDGDPTPRITSCMFVRACNEIVLEHFGPDDLGEADVVATEAELRALLQRRLGLA